MNFTVAFRYSRAFKRDWERRKYLPWSCACCFIYSSCGACYTQNMLKVCRTNLDLSVLWSGSFRRDKSWGLEAVKVDTERDNETFWQCALLLLTQVINHCVPRLHMHMHEPIAAKVKKKKNKKKGNRDKRKHCFSSAANTNAIIKLQFTTQTPLAQKGTFFGQWIAFLYHNV